MNKMFQIMLAMGLTSAIAQADWLDNFDSESTVDSVAPVGYNVYGGGTLDKGVTDITSVSNPNSAYVAVGLDGGGGFRSVLLHNTIAAMDLTGGVISVQLSSDVDLSGGGGIVGFHLYDADGSEFGTAVADRFAPSTSFGLFTQNISDLTRSIVWGDDPTLDTANIVRYGIDFFDPSGATTNAVFYIDDYMATVPQINSTSVTFAVININTALDAVEISWSATSGVTQVQYTPDLTLTSWTDLGGAFPGNGSTNYMLDPITNHLHRFYRVQVTE